MKIKINLKKLKYKIFKAFSYVLFLPLFACAHLNSDFTCPMQNGRRCESLDAVNKEVDQGSIGQSHVIQTVSLPLSNVEFNANSQLIFKDEQSSPIRSPETIISIWIAPYEDTDNNYHQASVIYTIVKPGHWVGNPLPPIDKDI